MKMDSPKFKKLVDFHISVKPVSIELICPYCSEELVIPWSHLSVPDYWGDDWGDIVCPECGQEISLGDYDYD